MLLGILTIVVLLPAAELQALRDALGSSLPVFFLSGLVGLSLVRLGAIRNARRSLESAQADPTRSWLLALTLFGVTLIAIVIIIESIFSFRSFELVVTALLPLWDAVGTVVSWILYGIIVIVLAPIFYVISLYIKLRTSRLDTGLEQVYSCSIRLLNAPGKVSVLHTARPIEKARTSLAPSLR